jgi:hypothetical protein
MGLFSAVGGLLGASGNRKAISRANDAANAGIDKAVGQLSGQQTDNNAAFAPYTGAGADATTSIANLLGLNGNDQSSAALEALKQSPLFTSQYDIGNRTVLQDQAATGGVRGGNTTGALAQFGSSLFGNVIQQQLANLMGVSSQGLSAANSNQGLNSNLSAGIAGLFGDQGNNNAGAILAKNHITDAAGKGFNSWLDASQQSNGDHTNGGSMANSAQSGLANLGQMLASLF